MFLCLIPEQLAALCVPKEKTREAGLVANHHAPVRPLLIGPIVDA